MKNIDVPFLYSDQPAIDLSSSEQWITSSKIQMDEVNWANFPYKPNVLFSIAHSNEGIYLKFWVSEEGIRGMVTEDNGNVFTDSCVEFFIDPTGDGSYYNFEFNCIGSLLLAFGSSRHHREKASPEILDKVLRYSTLGSNQIVHEKRMFEWELTVFIPFEAFFKHQISSLAGKTVRANLQKCGDEMAVPHFITWSPIATPQPDYHRPEFFGKLFFR